MADNDREFPDIPKVFDKLVISPNPVEVAKGKWKTELILRNHSDNAILYKVKCTSNQRIQIFDCADVLLPGNEIVVDVKKTNETAGKDQLLIVYCLVGKQWFNEDASALEVWNRAKAREVPTRNILIPICEK